MGVQVFGARTIEKHLRKVQKEIVLSEKKLIKPVEEARNRMVKRDLKGQTPQGGSFRKLNDDYADWKQEKVGRSRRDLQLTGQMHNAEQVKRITKGAEIYFNDETERKKAFAHHCGRNNQPRTGFFRLGKKLEKYIFSEWRKPIKKATK